MTEGGGDPGHSARFTEDDGGPIKMPSTVNQIVAYNVAYWRKAAGLTQEELGAELTKLTGHPWSKASVSAAERSWDGSRRARKFDADELLAICCALEIPLVALFLFPADDGIAARYEATYGPDTEYGATSRDMLGYLAPSFRPDDDDGPLLYQFHDRFEALVDQHFGEGHYAAEVNPYLQSENRSHDERLRARQQHLKEQARVLRSVVSEVDGQLEVIAARLGEMSMNVGDAAALLERHGWTYTHIGRRAITMRREGYGDITLDKNNDEPYDDESVERILTAAGLVELIHQQRVAHVIRNVEEQFARPEGPVAPPEDPATYVNPWAPSDQESES
jgi:transcriptional regulator with XRE-family HTH domain